MKAPSSCTFYRAHSRYTINRKITSSGPVTVCISMALSRILTVASRTRPPERSSLRFLRVCSLLLLLLIGFVSYARDRWTELNIGPFYVDTDGDVGAARAMLTQLEQVRWVLGGLLESKDLPSLWPIRIIATDSAKTNPTGQFVRQNSMYVLFAAPGSRLPLDEVTGLLLNANTPRLPDEVESGLLQLFGTLEARGSRVTWGGAPRHPDLAWARMQLFATRFDYGASFHIFFKALAGSTLRAAEQNAFGKDYTVLEQEAKANLAAGNWQPVSVSGRPLDPKRDFGEHALDSVIVGVYLADLDLPNHRDAAEAAYKSAVEAKGAAAALGYAGLARIAELNHENPKSFLDNAIHAGTNDAWVYVAAADGLDAPQALPLLKTAAHLNPLWAEPIYQQAQLAPDAPHKEALLKQAAQLAPRETKYWLELAQLQTSSGEATAAQGTWLRAEDSAPNAAERDRIHRLRLDSEQERLDAADDARRRDRESAHLTDQRAHDAELDRIRAAEMKANRTADTEAGTDKPEQVVPWDQVVAQKKLQGTLVRVDCLHTAARIWVKDKSGTSVQLLVKDSAQSGLPCGLQQPPRKISLAYAADPDERFHTVGTVVSLQLQ